MKNEDTPRRRAWFAGAVAVTILLGNIPSAAAASSISPKKWAKSFCTTVLDFRDELVSIGDQVVNYSEEAASAVDADPSAVFDVIETTAGYLDDAVDVSSDTADDVRKLKKPAVGGGAKIKRVISKILGDGLEDLAFEFEAGATDLRSIADQTSDPVEAANLFVTASLQLSSTFSSAGNAIRDAFNAVPDDPSIDPDQVLDRALARSSACEEF
ncbi:MAG: hypothetical protein WD598_05920 [Acidimicrobiia bacterium]